MEIYDLIIIGGGPAAISAGIYAGRKKLKTLLICKDWGGQMALTSFIENYPGIETISGMELTEKMKEQLEKNQIEIKENIEVREVEIVDEPKLFPERSRRGNFGLKLDSQNLPFDNAQGINFDFKIIKVKTDSGDYRSRTLIIANGRIPKRLDIPGEDKFKGRGLSYCVHCLHPNEQIIANSSINNIKDTEVSQKVLTINGTFQKIKEIMSSDYSGLMIKIKTRFFTDFVKLTPEHPVLRAIIKKGSGVNYWRDFKITKPEWVRAGELSNHDTLLYPIITENKDIEFIRLSEILNLETEKGKAKNKRETYTSHRIPDKISISSNFLRLVGYYLAEGSIKKQGVYFTFSKKEKDYIKDVKNLIESIFGIKAFLRNENNVTHVSIFSSIIRDLFQILFNKYAHNKKLPHWMLLLPPEKQKSLIKGIYRGDGCKRKKDFCIVSSSKVLIYQLRDIFLRLGIIPQIQRRAKSKLNRKPGNIEGREIRFNYDKYHIVIGGVSLKKMSKILGVSHNKIKERKWCCNHAWIKGGFLYLPIRTIKKIYYKGKVYNLFVNKNNTYVAKNFLVHNCDAPFFKDKDAAIIGGGNAGLEAALDLTNYAKKIYILEFSPQLTADEVLREKIREFPRIVVLTEAAAKEIKGDNFVRTLVYEDKKSGENKELAVQGVFSEIGWLANSNFIKDVVKLNQWEEIIIDKENRTSEPNIFAAGDITDVSEKQIIIAAGEGAKAALTAYKYLKNKH